MYAAGVGAALLAATLATLLIPVGYQLLRVETPLSFSVFCLIDLFGRAPEGEWSDGTAIRGLLAYRRTILQSDLTIEQRRYPLD